MKGSSKNISYFRIIMWIRILFGIYSKISPSRFVCGLAKTYCILFFIFFVSMYIDYIYKFLKSGFNIELNIPVNITVYEFIVAAFWNLYYRNEQLFKFNSVVKSIDCILHWEVKEGNVKVSFYMCLTIILSKTLAQVLVFGKIGFESPINLAGFFMTISHFVAILSIVMTMELFYSRLKYIRIYLSSCDRQMTEEQKMFIVKKFLYVYKSFMNIVQRMGNEISYITVNFAMTSSAVDQILENILLFGTVWFAELALQEFALIKGILGDQVLECSDESYREVLYRTLQFIEVRPPRFTALRVIPIDVRLILALISVCSNYIIILLQFEL